MSPSCSVCAQDDAKVASGEALVSVETEQSEPIPREKRQAMEDGAVC